MTMALEMTIKQIIQELKEEHWPRSCWKYAEFYDLDKDYDVEIRVLLIPKIDNRERIQRIFTSSSS